ncbi:hypothetical protein Acid345_1004 [Candidatus Koribacter versatilis Ellin345]|uniref:Peptidase M1 membrane alanine aminopeptidase domain-containing protein n=1 Tax=Koribacter versatilis (strain Ellin345) TaxID=204669 RepID=Q1ISZ3_KORVE|nr:hypothetical protein Acid345_1004 [Candidatus Koribacter versatilis Ellin345]
MKFIRSILVLFVLSAAAFGADRNALTFTQYNLKTTVTPTSQGFEAEGTVTLRNDSATPQKWAVLQVSSSLEWRYVRVGSEEVQFIAQPYTTDIDHTGAVSEVTVTLPKPLEPKQSVTLNIAYGGTIALDAKRLTRVGTPDADATRSDWDQVSNDFTAVRGLGFVAWYPVVMEAASLSDGNAVFSTIGQWRSRNRGAEMHLAICLPAKEAGGRMIVANGTESQAKPDEGCKAYDYRLGPMTVPAFVVGNFQELKRPVLTVYHEQGHTTAAQDYAAEFERLQPFAAGWFGAPKEHAMYVELTGRAVTPYETGALMFAPLGQGERMATDLSAAYQLGQVSVQSFRPWIDYGTAHFLQFLVVEREMGRANALAYLQQYARPLATADKDPAKDPAAQSLINTDDELLYRGKSLFVWSMLRDLVGDEALSAAVQSYRPEDDHDASYMQKLIESHAHKDLEWFFDDWVYRDRGLPDFHIVSAYPRQILGGQYLVTITVENLGSAAAEVPVSAQVNGGEKSVRIFVKPGEKATARINTQQVPTSVTVNDGSVPERDMTNNKMEVKPPAQ